MENISIFFITTWTQIVEWYQIFTDSTFFTVIKFFLIIYITILFVDLVLLIYVDGFKKRLRQQFGGTNKPISKKPEHKKWLSIKSRLKTNQMDQYKLAILEADHLVDKALENEGYNGDNFIERLSQIPQHFFSDLEEVKKAHQLRNEIIRNDSSQVTRKQTEETIEIFETFLKKLDVL